jgi:hypothetical protein
MKTQLIILLAVVNIFATCAAKKKSAKNTSDKYTEVKEVIVDQNFNLPENNADFSIDEMKIDGDILLIDVSYSGGCKDHDFKAYFNGMYIKTSPMKAKVFIVHTNNDDNCRALIKQTLRFNLKPVRSGDRGMLIIMLNNTEKTLTYEY